MKPRNRVDQAQLGWPVGAATQRPGALPLSRLDAVVSTEAVRMLASDEERQVG